MREPEVQVWWGSLLDADHQLLELLDATERARITALERPADRGRSMVGAALLRTAVADDLGCSPAGVELDRTCPECGDPHGRPRVIGPLPASRTTPPWVSVSHSGHLVVVVLCPTHPVGVDVQRISDVDHGVDPGDWVEAEARLKSGITDEASSDQTCRIDTPVAGYAAAVTVTHGPGRTLGQPLGRPALVQRTWHHPSAAVDAPG
ncbi:MAG TPA: hypothetical protein VK045_04650 [Ornithinicoccus sp.]|nr:hypothetical protein [Ornithinicoccus sp.]